jgi:uncharacterized protein (DUF2147 family)
MLFTACKIRVSSLCAIILCAISLQAASAAQSPVGLWKTFDDKTHEARGTIRIFEKDGTFQGRIESSLKPEEQTERCDKCSGDRKDAPIIGLVIMRGMRKHGAEYDAGEILDPETGSVYKCRFTLSDDGEKLYLKGYLGLSIFGRTQTWIRVR